MPLSDAELIRRAKEVLPNLNTVEEFLGDDPARRLAETVVPSGARRTRRTRAIVGPESEGGSESAATDAAFEATAAGMLSAVRKIRDRGIDADLSPTERDGAEAIIELLGRPAIFIQSGKFFPPPPPWTEKLEAHRDAIEATLRSVGRIEVDGHPSLDWVGTGFLVAQDVVITNRHVAKEFARSADEDEWVFERDMTSLIDFAEELDESPPREFALTEVIGVSDDVDLALLRARRQAGGGELPPPLPLTNERIAQKGREIYVVGYPASDSRRNDPEEMRKIFSKVFDVKRLQPGLVRESQPRSRRFSHDASTLGGNSGSCVLDLQTHRVIGLHYSGRYLKANYAVDLTLLTREPLLKRAGVEFG